MTCNPTIKSHKTLHTSTSNMYFPFITSRVALILNPAQSRGQMFHDFCNFLSLFRPSKVVVCSRFPGPKVVVCSRFRHCGVFFWSHQHGDQVSTGGCNGPLSTVVGIQIIGIRTHAGELMTILKYIDTNRVTSEVDSDWVDWPLHT